MGLTTASTGSNVIDYGLILKKSKKTDKIIALAGNPNVGKSTLFNALTGMNQHTGNWAGKTVTNACGKHTYNGQDYIFVDLPGTYSLMSHSTEEEIARDFICFGPSDTVIVICDATCLERNLNLVLQTIEITPNVIVCTNLMDQAKKKKITLDLNLLEHQLGVPVIATTARNKDSISALLEGVKKQDTYKFNPIKITYSDTIEKAIALLIPVLDTVLAYKSEKWLSSRWVALKLLEQDESLLSSLSLFLGYSITENAEVVERLVQAKKLFAKDDITADKLHDLIVSDIVICAEKICTEVVCVEATQINQAHHRLDKILTSRLTGFPIMLGVLFFVLWLTIIGSNYPSQLIAKILFWFQYRLSDFFSWMHSPSWVHGLLVLGIYRTLAWVVSVMLPPMAIFFPLFTLLEDFGYLPRVAFLLDHQFKKCHACGKQSLTMCMSFGCNAAGIVGCRIIDSPRERLIAIISNNFVPCNGRFPTLISIITMFFIMNTSGPLKPFLSSLALVGVILLGVFMTFLVSNLLSKTVLKGVPSSFTLELPCYRKPQIGKVIIRSLFDRTLFVLGRAIMIAAPAGLIIWVMGNVFLEEASLLTHVSNFLDPFAHTLGLDGVILLAFILGFPANEIVFPIIIMTYMSSGSILELGNLTMLRSLLVDHGWTFNTAISTMLFCLMHWPCSTTCLTIKKETAGLKWTLLSIFIPTVIGLLCCFLFTSFVRLFGFI